MIINKEREQELAAAAEVILARFAPGWIPEIGCGYGWYPILIDLDRDLEAISPNYKINQIKEKFGGLRYYIQYPEQMGLERIFQERIPCPKDPDSLKLWQADFESFKNSPEGQRLLGEIEEQNTRMQTCLRQAEARAACTCEICGQAGSFRESDFYMVRCESCLLQE